MLRRVARWITLLISVTALTLVACASDDPGESGSRATQSETTSSGPVSNACPVD